MNLNQISYELKYLNKVLHGDFSELIKGIPDSSIDLVVTSPPFNAGKDYGEEVDDNLPKLDYLNLLYTFLKESRRVLKHGGKIVIDLPTWIPSIMIKPDMVVYNLMMRVGLVYRETIYWIKGEKRGDGIAVSGGKRRFHRKNPVEPMITPVATPIVIGYKGSLFRMDRLKEGEKNLKWDITEKEYNEFSSNVWIIPPLRYRKYDHEAAFPDDIPYRAIKLFTFIGDTVLDPFVGIGTTALVAKRLKRNFIGFELSRKSYSIAIDRLEGIIV